MITLLRYIVLIILGLTSFKLFSKQIKGYIYNEDTNKPVKYANIYWENYKVGVYSDTLGRFVLPSINEEDTIVISCIGYYAKRVIKSNEINVSLKPKVTVLESIDVYGTRENYKIHKLGFFNSSISRRGSITRQFSDHPIPKNALKIVGHIKNTFQENMYLQSVKFKLHVEAQNPEKVAARIIFSEVTSEPSEPGSLLNTSDLFLYLPIENGNNIISIDKKKFGTIIVPKEGIHIQVCLYGIVDNKRRFIEGDIKTVYSKNKTKKLYSYATVDSKINPNFLFTNRRGLYFNYSIWIEASK